MQLLRYPGGKSKASVQKLVRDHFPVSFREHREAFTGGGGLLLNRPTGTACWANDINPALMSVYTALRDTPDSFIKSCRAITPAMADEEMITTKLGSKYPKRMHDLFWQTAQDDSMDPALRYFTLNRLGWNGRVILEPNRRKRMYFSNPTGWNIVKGDRLEKAAAVLAGARISCGDFEPLFTEPGEDVLVFADPPYVRDSELNQSAKLYEFGFSLDDHHRLRDVAFGSDHAVCLTYDDHPLVRELYRGWRIHQVSWHYCGTVTNRRRGHELIITNYPVRADAQMVAA